VLGRLLVVMAVVVGVVALTGCGSGSPWSATTRDLPATVGKQGLRCGTATRENPSEPGDHFYIVVCTTTGKSYACFNPFGRRQAFDQDCEDARDAVRDANLIP
jgi:hypothetical protein